MPNVSQLIPENQYPKDALKRSVQEQPVMADIPGAGTMLFTWNIASATDTIQQWGRNVTIRDRQLRDFWPTEPYLAGAVGNVAFGKASLQWEITGPDRVSQAVTDMLKGAISGDTFGWTPFMLRFCQDLYTADNGAFIELIRDPGMDANSRFKGENAPVIGIANLDSGACIRTGRMDYPVLYTDIEGKVHKMAWYQVIPFADFPSPIQSMHGVGYCSVSRILRMSQIMRSIMVYKDEKVSGRHFKQIHFVSGVSRQDIKDEMVRGQEDANNMGLVRFIQPSILASLDPEKPVSTATIDLASLPDGFDYDTELKWYINGLSLAFGVDYQEFAPLPAGNMGSSQQSQILDRKGAGKSHAAFMQRLTEAFKNYGVLPRVCEMTFQDRDEQEALERQTVRTKAMEEAAIAVNSGILTAEAAAQDLVKRGIYEAETISGIPADYWQMRMMSGIKVGQPVGDRGGNTLADDAARVDTSRTRDRSDTLRKEEEPRERDIIVVDASGNVSKEMNRIHKMDNEFVKKAMENQTKAVREVSEMNKQTAEQMAQANRIQAQLIFEALAKLGDGLNNIASREIVVPAPIVNVSPSPAPVVQFNPKIEVQAPVPAEVGKVKFIKDGDGNWTALPQQDGG